MNELHFVRGFIHVLNKTHHALATNMTSTCYEMYRTATALDAILRGNNRSYLIL